jgi:hypothetical protein
MRRLEEAEGIKIDLLICCGDFQVQSALSAHALSIGDVFLLAFQNITCLQFDLTHVGKCACWFANNVLTSVGVRHTRTRCGSCLVGDAVLLSF